MTPCDLARLATLVDVSLGRRGMDPAHRLEIVVHLHECEDCCTAFADALAFEVQVSLIAEGLQQFHPPFPGRKH